MLIIMLYTGNVCVLFYVFIARAVQYRIRIILNTVYTKFSLIRVRTRTSNSYKSSKRVSQVYSAAETGDAINLSAHSSIY